MNNGSSVLLNYVKHCVHDNTLDTNHRKCQNNQGPTFGFANIRMVVQYTELMWRLRIKVLLILMDPLHERLELVSRGKTTVVASVTFVDFCAFQ